MTISNIRIDSLRIAPHCTASIPTLRSVPHLHPVGIFLDGDSPADQCPLRQHVLSFLLHGSCDGEGRPVRGPHVVLPIEGNELGVVLYRLPVLCLQHDTVSLRTTPHECRRAITLQHMYR